MHCPRCGQRQVSEETKFCSKCGLPLAVIADVVVHGGTLPQLDMLNQPKKKWLTRRNGMVFSLFWFIFFLLIVTPFFGIINAPDALTGMSAILGIFGGLLWLLASAFFLEGKSNDKYHYPYPMAPHQMPQYPPQMTGQPYQPGALPPQQSVPAQSYTPPAAGSWRDTNDLGRPSVIEGTTKLLQKEEEE